MSTVQTTNIKHAASASNNITLDASGNVGVGTTPGAAAGYTFLTVLNNTTGSAVQTRSGSVDMRLQADTVGAGYAGTISFHPVIFWTNASERMRIDVSGNVGLGTSSPRARFHVGGFNGPPSLSSDASNIALTTSNTSVELAQGALASGAFPYWVQTKQSVNSGAAFPLAINPLGGNVGIGTLNPTSRLHVDGAAITATIGPDYNGGVAYNNGNQRLEVNAWNAFPMLYLGRHNVNSLELSVASNGDGIFGQASLERMRIVGATGNVGIGTSGPVCRLDAVVANPTRGIVAQVNNAGTSGLTGSQLSFLQNTINWWTIGQPAATDAFAVWQSRHVGADGIERLRINSAGDLQFNSGYGSVATAYGCRAWVNFNGTGTVAIRGSANVSSITDNGTGSYTVNFASAMPDVNYSAQAVGDHVPGVYESRASIRNGTVATGSVRVDFHNGGNAPVDVTTACVAIFR